jgi:hypothetical protein
MEGSAMNQGSVNNKSRVSLISESAFRVTTSIALMAWFLLLVPAASGRLPDPASVPGYPRIAMLWSEAEGPGEKPAKWARYGVIVTGVNGLGLRWEPNPYKDAAEKIVEGSIPAARKTLEELGRRNPGTVVLCELYFFEADADAYPPDSPWWYRDKDGKRVEFWKGCYNMAVEDASYVEHIARRVEAVHKALGGKAGIFLDNLRFDAPAKAGWTELLKKVRERCAEIPILVNAGWDSDDLRWVAPWINGIMYEDSVAHTADGDTEKYYARINSDWQLLREPRIGVNEVFGPRRDEQEMMQELVRTLAYTDLYFLYSDSTYGHRHSWWPQWDVPLGKAMQPPAVPAPGKLARRDFAGGSVFWLPATARESVSVKLDKPMRRLAGGGAIDEVSLQPGSGTVMLHDKTGG